MEKIINEELSEQLIELAKSLIADKLGKKSKELSNIVADFLVPYVKGKVTKKLSKIDFTKDAVEGWQTVKHWLANKAEKFRELTPQQKAKIIARIELIILVLIAIRKIRKARKDKKAGEAAIKAKRRAKARKVVGAVIAAEAVKHAAKKRRK